MCSGGPARGTLRGRSPRCPAPRGARCLGRRQCRTRSSCPRPAPRRPSDQGRLRRPRVRATGTRAREAAKPRVFRPPALAPYLQQLHVARREPAAEPVLLLAFPPAAVRDLQQRDQLARGEAQPLAVPLPGEGVQGPAAGAGHGLGARAHRAACIPDEPRGLGSGSAGSQAPGAPGSRALGARRLGGARGVPGQAGDARSAQGSGDSQASRSKRRRPRAGQLADPALGGGAGLRGRRPRRRGLRRQLPGDAERGLRPRGPAGAGAARARGNAQLPGEVGSRASPGARLGGEGAAGRPQRRAGGRVAERGLARRRGGGAGRGLDQGGHARGRLGAPSPRGQVAGEGSLRSHPRLRKPLEQKRPSAPALWVWWQPAGGGRLLRGACEGMCLRPPLSGLDLGLNLTHRKLNNG